MPQLTASFSALARCDPGGPHISPHVAPKTPGTRVALALYFLAESRDLSLWGWRGGRGEIKTAILGAGVIAQG